MAWKRHILCLAVAGLVFGFEWVDVAVGSTHSTDIVPFWLQRTLLVSASVI